MVAVVIGAGQAGLATSRELAGRGVEHVVLEAGCIGETWRTRRWRSFRLVSPNWMNRLPGSWYDGPDPDGFFDAAEMLDYLERYAESFRAPVRAGMPVASVVRGARGFVVATPAGEIECDAVVVATGAFGHAWVPPMADQLPEGILSIHTERYRAPEELAPGNVVIVGAGQSGLQIADELALAGRDVWVAVGHHGWLPRNVLGRDQMWWRLENGDFAEVVGDPEKPAADYPFTPLARWGREDFNLLTIARNGVRYTGRLVAISDGRMHFAPNLAGLLREGDEYARKFVRRVHDLARGRGEQVPEAELSNAWPEAATPEGSATLDLAGEKIATVIWATGYRQDFSWIRVPGALSEAGAPYQRGGVSPVPGLYFVGLHRGWHAGDGTVLGSGWLPEQVAEVIARS